MSLLHVGKLLGIPSKANGDHPLQVVVHGNDSRTVGLVVDQIVDIAEATVEATRPVRKHDLLASAVIQQQVTDLLDVASLVRRADPTFYDSPCEKMSVT
jgi:two-component system chemotaxis sensor kinase CheA